MLMRRPEYLDPLTEGIECLKQVANGEMNAEDYFSKRKDSRGRYTMPWPELIWVRKNDVSLYIKFLMKLTFQQRRLVLLREEIIGFTQTELYELYLIHKDMVSRFLGRYKTNKRTDKKGRKRTRPPKIRSIIPTDEEFEIDVRLISFFSVLMRVPPDWIMFENPAGNWTSDHYRISNSMVMDEQTFLSCLRQERDAKYHDVVPVILDFKGYELHIRLEFAESSFLLEYVNAGLHLGAFNMLIDLIKPMVNKIGFVRTVVPFQLNLAIINGNSAKIMPPEFTEITESDLLKSIRVEKE